MHALQVALSGTEECLNAECDKGKVPIKDDFQVPSWSIWAFGIIFFDWRILEENEEEEA